MSRPKMVPLKSPDEIPKDMDEAQARAFWDTHEITDEYLRNADVVPADVLPPTRPP